MFSDNTVEFAIEMQVYFFTSKALIVLGLKSPGIGLGLGLKDTGLGVGLAILSLTIYITVFCFDVSVRHAQH